MQEYLKFVRELADLIEEIGYKEALGSVEYRWHDEDTWHNDDWREFNHENYLPTNFENFAYRIRPATTHHRGGEMPQHVTPKSFKNGKSLFTPFFGFTNPSHLNKLYGRTHAHKMAFDTAEKAKAAEKVMRGF